MDNFISPTITKFSRIGLFVCGLLGQKVAFAQVDLQDCARIEGDAERLACYDELAQRTAESSELRNTTAPEPTPEGQTEIVSATVTKATHSPYTGWIITFDNGQSWKQIGTDSFAIREGDACRIEPAVLNSFRLQCGNRTRQIRVAREE